MTGTGQNIHGAPRAAKYFETGLHLMVLAAAVAMVIWVSQETLENKSFLADSSYMHFQFWVCILFLFDITVEWIMSPRKWKYICTHLLFIIVSVPYLNILEWAGIDVQPRIMYLIRLVPLFRAGYVLALVSRTFTSRQSLSMLWVYITWVAVSVYFAAMMFFVEEHYINPQVDTFWTSLWWAFLEMTTCGTNIPTLTPTGKVLGVVLSVEGLTLFPVFTVYITNAVLKINRSRNDGDSSSDTAASVSSPTAEGSAAGSPGSANG